MKQSFKAHVRYEYRGRGRPLPYILTEEDNAMAELEEADGEKREVVSKKKIPMTIKEAIEAVRLLDHQAANIEDRKKLAEAKEVLAAQDVQRVKG